MTSNPSPAIERQLREAWARKEWEYPDAQNDYQSIYNSLELVGTFERFLRTNPEYNLKIEPKDKNIPANWRDQCKPPLDDEGDE